MPAFQTYIDSQKITDLSNLSEDLTLAARDALLQMIDHITRNYGLSPEQAMDFIADFIKGSTVDNPLPDILLGSALKLAVEDLKAYYFEAVTNQPGQPTDSKTLADWFWGQTAAAQVINKVREVCMASNDEKLALAGKMFLIPRVQLHRFEN